jgi:adenosyl cobinamide kinase/adenosyl cobinamide phosphate guanylyltransferase
MVLVIGGLAAGKREYVKNTFGYSDADMADAVLDGRPVLYNLQDLTAKTDKSEEELLPLLLQKDVVICNETGNGIVPVDKAERIARELTGRLCIQLATHAEKVVRVVCGIPQVLKES